MGFGDDEGHMQAHSGRWQGPTLAKPEMLIGTILQGGSE
jgi:hypothetical protein